MEAKVLLLSLFMFLTCKSWSQNSDKNLDTQDTDGYKKTCPGKWSIYPSKLVSGAETKLEIRYLQGGNDLPAGSSHIISVENMSVKDVFHSIISEDMEIIPYKDKLPKIEMEQLEYSGIGYRLMKLTFPNGLEAGDSFALVIGNRDKQGNVKAIINPFPYKLGLPTFTDFGDGNRIDWVDQGWFDNIPKCEILPGKPEVIRLFAPTIVKTNEEFNLKLSITDKFDHFPKPHFNGTIQIEYHPLIENLIDTIYLDSLEGSHKTISKLKIGKEGIYRIRAKIKNDNVLFESNPIVVKKSVDEKIYWGSLHNHGEYSEGFGGDISYFYEFARDISGMDFVALSDHIGVQPSNASEAGRLFKWRTGRTISALDAWKNTITTANKYNRENSFVTLIGYEWSTMESGHYNVYMPDASLENMEKMFLAEKSPYALEMRNLLEEQDALFIPHLHADKFPWLTLEERLKNSKGNLLTPVVEVYSDWGAAVEPFAGKIEPMNKFGGIRHPNAKGTLWAWNEGYHLGTIADADEHAGLPGRRVVGGIAPKHDHPAGLTAVGSTSFSRRGITDAYHKMKTYGTTGERIYLNVKINNAVMGDILKTDGPFKIDISVAGTDEIDKISLYRGLELIKEVRGNNKKDINISIECDAPDFKKRAYIIQVTQKDENMAWSTPIWVIKKSIPELAWKVDGDKIILNNLGEVPAYNIEVLRDDLEHTFTTGPISGSEPQIHSVHDFGYVFSNVRDNQKSILHYRWHGKPLKGIMKISGIRDVDLDYNRPFLITKSFLRKTDENTYEFLLNEHHLEHTSVGFDIMVNINYDKPAFVEFDFEREVHTSINNKMNKGNRIKIPLNGRLSNDSFDIKVIPKLGKGKSMEFPIEKGHWSVDPFNKINEYDETNNLYSIK